MLRVAAFLGFFARGIEGDGIFDLAGRAAAARFLDALTIPPRTASLGSIQTIAVHPASTTHRQLSDQELETAGIAPGMVRMSVGLEDVEDLKADIQAALDVAVGPGDGDHGTDPAPAEGSRATIPA